MKMLTALWAPATFAVLSFFAIEAIPDADSRSPTAGSWTLVGWNDLGMHCMDGDYGVFSILPPYNTLEAQLIDQNGDLVTSPGGITVTYEAVADPSGSINTTSAGKTNFWQFGPSLYGASGVVNAGLAGHDMPGPGNTPQPMVFTGGDAVFRAEGIPLTPYDDLGRKRYYPMMHLVARNGGGQILATTDVVLPVSDEMDCRKCHASGGSLAAQPNAGWLNDANPERDFRLNILKLHDDREAANPAYQAALLTAGYDAAGLHATVAVQGTPVLCAACHASNALPGTGITGILPLTAAIHGRHAYVTDPGNGMTLESSANRSACYTCHPGSETRCLRGAMGSAVAANGTLAMQCQDCHGSMTTVGSPAREGWLDQPNCQNCHTGTALSNNGQIRYETVFEPGGQPRVAVNNTFATDPNTPAPGFSLYRFSTGHGGLRCEACHGSTHAEYPSLHGNDNIQVEALQGHGGMLVDCTTCHDQDPETVTGGPHGMHPVGDEWMDDHGDAAENGNHLQCRTCHGSDYKGTVLSLSLGDRVFNTEFGLRHFWRGFRISCYACHNGPTSENASPNHAPVVQNTTAQASDQPVMIPLTATDQDQNPLTLRVISQPQYGTVALSGTQATYFPEPGFAGPDTFTFAAWDGLIDSNLGTVTVTRGGGWFNYGTGFPGTGGVVPAFVASAAPVLGTTIQISAQNTSGAASVMALVVSDEPASTPTPLGGSILVLLTAPPIVAPIPASGWVASLALPTDPSLIGVTVRAQVAIADPGAAFGLAFSEGLCLIFGP